MAYADVITLLDPFVFALRKMLATCGTYANDYDLMIKH
jgi:hypothetical protein